MPEKKLAAKRLKVILFWIAATFVFTIIHNKSPLYNSNETTKLLHGIALGGRGDLASDWFANTTDPLPFFSFFIASTFRYVGEWFFYLYYAALLGIFLYSVMAIFSITEGLDRSKTRYVAFMAIVALLYSRFFREASLRFADISLYSFVTGVAEQYLINPLFQNSLFGVFLILSISLFLKKRPYLAAICLGVASTVHSAFLFGAATLTLAYMIRMYKDERNIKKPIFVGAFTLLLVLPTLIYGYGATSIADEEGAAGQVLSIIVNERIPQHSLPSVWLDGPAWLKLCLVVAAVVVNRRSRLFEILLVPLICAILGTFAQVATGSLTIALIAPWRVSVFLVPLATLSLCAAAIRALFERGSRFGERQGRIILGVSIAVIAACFVGGLYTQTASFKSASRSPARQLARFVDGERAGGDLYLLDPRENDLESFRLLSGAPIVANWKSHPYKDVEVLEWYERIGATTAFYQAASAADARRLLEGLRSRYGITHLVAKRGSLTWIDDLKLEKAYENARYALYRLAASADPTASR